MAGGAGATGPDVGAWYWSLLLAVLAVGYAGISVPLWRRRRWPLRRMALWYAGLITTAVAVTWPALLTAHHDFPRHMVGHLLLGMLAPLLLVLSAPLTMLLRALPVAAARRLARCLRYPVVRWLSHPITAAVLDMGGLWLLYTTGLFTAMHQRPLLGVLINLHVLLAGYLFTFAMIGVDPAPHRPSYRFRAVVLVLALAAHAVLAKWLYVHPPAGVPREQAEVGAMLMYYGGDAVDLLLIVVFCRQWFVASRPRLVATQVVA